MGLCFPEYARLRTVLMHSPGKELDLIRPTTYGRFLFADAIDQDRFREDHASFVDVLRSEGVSVVLVGELLRQKPQLLASAERLPNLVYLRDTAAVTRAGYVLARMSNPVRRSETGLVEAALRQLGIEVLLKTKAPATIECGDLIFFDEETLLVGVRNRTNMSGLRELRKITTKSGLRTLAAVPLPRWAIHLDGTMMIIDRDLAIAHARSLGETALVFEDGKVSARVTALQLLRKLGMSLIEITEYERQRRAANVIAIAPRKVVGYAGNARVKRELVKNDVDFVEIEGAELIRGFGGPRCMTLPILRG